ncbi:hypothetical protein ACKFKG_06490 [Phormidesmis sp. 146-35]
MQGSLSTYKIIVPSTQHHSVQPTNVAAVNVVLGSLAIAFPIVVGCAIVSYRTHRAMVVRRQIQRLNRIWQLDSSNNLS